jgi:hypothetical protein
LGGTVTERSSGYGLPEEPARYRDGTADQQYPPQGAAGQYYRAQGMADSGFGGPTTGSTPRSATRQAAHERGFLASLFDVSFTSFITTKIIKVLYVLVMIVIVLAAVAFTAFAFLANPVFGLLALVIGAPLYIIITLALWRLYFEAAIVFFRIAEDIRALRERAEIR